MKLIFVCLVLAKSLLAGCLGVLLAHLIVGLDTLGVICFTIANFQDFSNFFAQNPHFIFLLTFFVLLHPSSATVLKILFLVCRIVGVVCVPRMVFASIAQLMSVQLLLNLLLVAVLL